MTEKRFERYLLDGGFWFEEYVEPVWQINDAVDKDSPIKYLEFRDEYKDLCDEVVRYLNNLHEKNEELKSEIEKITKYKEHWAFISDCSIQVMNEEEKFKEDYLRIATNELKKLQEENEQLKANYNSLSHNNGLLYNECSNKINALKKENEQLKQYNQRITKVLEDGGVILTKNQLTSLIEMKNDNSVEVRYLKTANAKLKDEISALKKENERLKQRKPVENIYKVF